MRNQGEELASITAGAAIVRESDAKRTGVINTAKTVP